MMRKILLTVMISAVLLMVTSAFANQAAKDPLTLFQKALTQDGFDMTPGSADIFDPLGKWCAGKMTDAMMVNSGLYLVLNVPKPGELSNPIPRFKIRHDEAIVLIGRTPPPAKYFGFYTFIASRFFPDKQERTDILGTLGDTVKR